MNDSLEDKAKNEWYELKLNDFTPFLGQFWYSNRMAKKEEFPSEDFSERMQYCLRQGLLYTYNSLYIFIPGAMILRNL